MNTVQAPTDEEVLGVLRCLYELTSPYWEPALIQAMTVLGGTAGLVAYDGGHGFEVQAQDGTPLALIPELTPARPGFSRMQGVYFIRVRHTELPGDSLWMIGGAADTTRLRLRMASLCSNLALAIDYAEKRGRVVSLSHRLSPPDTHRLNHAQQALGQLSQRAKACVLLAARGYTNPMIANYLGLTHGTVARALQGAYRELGVTGRSELDIYSLLTLGKPPRG